MICDLDIIISILRARAIDIPVNAKWIPSDHIAAGENRETIETNELNFTHGLYVDNDQTVYVVDQVLHISTDEELINANRWKHVISSYLPNLRIFDVLFNVDNGNSAEQVLPSNHHCGIIDNGF
ncbi:hypothetical protein I4U23_016025 [Adineta vaga]|nr:hypothetical protein I4U23_016025 [Adineta vaga]